MVSRMSLWGSCFHLPHTLLSFSKGETHLRVEGMVFWLGQLIGLGDFWMPWGSKHFRTPQIQNKIMEIGFSWNLTKFIINFEWHNHIKKPYWTTRIQASGIDWYILKILARMKWELNIVICLLTQNFTRMEQN